MLIMPISHIDCLGLVEGGPGPPSCCLAHSCYNQRTMDPSNGRMRIILPLLTKQLKMGLWTWGTVLALLLWLCAFSEARAPFKDVLSCWEASRGIPHPVQPRTTHTLRRQINGLDVYWPKTTPSSTHLGEESYSLQCKHAKANVFGKKSCSHRSESGRTFF